MVHSSKDSNALISSIVKIIDVGSALFGHSEPVKAKGSQGIRMIAGGHLKAVEPPRLSTLVVGLFHNIRFDSPIRFTIINIQGI